MERIHWIRLITFKYSISDIIDYFRSQVRYYMYYHKKHWLKPHILEQISFRINLMMDKECYNRGSCKICGCKTTYLQMANKSCEGECYPHIMTKSEWEKFKSMGSYFSENSDYYWYNKKNVKRFTKNNIQFLVKVPFNKFEDVE